MELLPVDRREVPPVDRREAPPIVRREVPPVVRREAPPIVRRETPPVVRREAPLVVRKEAPLVVRKEALASRGLPEFDARFDGKLVVTADASEAAIEQYDRLAEALVRWQSERGAKTIMVSSALPREGRTLTITNLALTLSERLGQHVLLVDADLISPSIHEIFNLSNATGLSDSLDAGRAQMPVVDVSARLTVLPAGSADVDPMETLVSNGMRSFILDSAPRFDWILLDTPAASLVTDPHLLAWLCDGVLLVVGAGATSYRVVEQAIADLGADRVIGTVLNRAGRAAGPKRNGSKAAATTQPGRTFLID